jgi:hypothetical protein
MHGFEASKNIVFLGDQDSKVLTPYPEDSSPIAPPIGLRVSELNTFEIRPIP